MTHAHLERLGTAIALVACGLTTLLSILLMPDFSGDEAAQLAAIAAAPATAAISALCFAGSQLFLILGVLGVARMLRDRAPVLAPVGAGLIVVGAFGHAVYGGITLLMLTMAQDRGNNAIHAALLAQSQEGAVLPMMVAGLVGTVLGFLVFGVALLRARWPYRWIGAVMIGWVLVEFVGGNFSSWAGYASAVLFLVLFGAMAVAVLRSPWAYWQTGGPARTRTADEVPVAGPTDFALSREEATVRGSGRRHR